MSSLNPGRIEPASSAWEETRKPLAAVWKTVNGDRLYTVNVHLSSKRDSSSSHGNARPPVNGHSERRTHQVNVTAVNIPLTAAIRFLMFSGLAGLCLLYTVERCQRQRRSSWRHERVPANALRLPCPRRARLRHQRAVWCAADRAVHICV
jgi:hypothetical protein